MQNEILFFDSSALIKKFIDEKGTSQVNHLMNSCSLILISDLTIIECITIARRYLNERLIDLELFNHLKREILSEMSSMETISPNKVILSASISILDNFYIKTLDNIQLASALNSEFNIDGFVSSDIKLNRIAEKLNFNVINPILK